MLVGMAESGVLAILRRSLTVRVLIALVAGVLVASAFLEVADDVLDGDTTAVDRRISLQLYALHNPVLDMVMRAITFLGSGWVLTGLVASVAGWALWRRRRMLAGIVVAVGLAAQTLNALLKSFFQRPRPDLLEIVYPDSFSFPSGHAMNSAAIYGILMLAVVRLAPRWRWPVYGATPLLVVLIGTSRVYLGVHWATDVLAGLAAGTLLPIAAALAVHSDAASSGAPDA